MPKVQLQECEALAVERRRLSEEAKVAQQEQQQVRAALESEGAKLHEDVVAM
jgi:hypothetical protein